MNETTPQNSGAPMPAPQMPIPNLGAPATTLVKKHTRLTIALRIIAVVIPLSLLLYVLYWNFLPFGFSKTYTIKVGSLQDTSGEFYLEASRYLSERKDSTASGANYSYREVTGPVTATFKPTAVLKNTTLTATVEGDSVSIIPSYIDFKPDTAEWDYSWDFTGSIPTYFSGNAFSFDGCAFFDGKSRISLADSENGFEEGPFSVYAEWQPENPKGVSQEIIGHFNWELFQNDTSVSFQVGRMDNAKGQMFTLKYPVKPDFFNTKHSLLAIYSPSPDEDKNGYIELFVDGNFAGITNIGQQQIWASYGNSPLTLGWSEHNNGSNPYLTGCVYSARFTNQAVIENSHKALIRPLNTTTKIFITNETAKGTLRTVTLKVNE